MVAALHIDETEQASAPKQNAREEPRAAPTRTAQASHRERMDAALEAFVEANDAVLAELAKR